MNRPSQRHHRKNIRQMGNYTIITGDDDIDKLTFDFYGVKIYPIYEKWYDYPATSKYSNPDRFYRFTEEVN